MMTLRHGGLRTLLKVSGIVRGGAWYQRWSAVPRASGVTPVPPNNTVGLLGRGAKRIHPSPTANSVLVILESAS